MMEETVENNNPSSSDSKVLKISENMESKRSTFIPPPAQINPTSFPLITSRILFKTDVPPPAVPIKNPSDLDQYLCFLCLDKPSQKKRVYHMYLSNNKDLEKDTELIRKMYENRKDLTIVDRNFWPTLCARSLCHRVQNKLSNVTWNKQKTIFETDWIGGRDVWNTMEKIGELHLEEMEKFFNFLKFMSATNS